VKGCVKYSRRRSLQFALIVFALKAAKATHYRVENQLIFGRY
jgi:hypothetical protein